jgi:hypothetical protein
MRKSAVKAIIEAAPDDWIGITPNFSISSQPFLNSNLGQTYYSKWDDL